MRLNKITQRAKLSHWEKKETKEVYRLEKDGKEKFQLQRMKVRMEKGLRRDEGEILKGSVNTLDRRKEE